MTAQEDFEQRKSTVIAISLVLLMVLTISLFFYTKFDFSQAMVYMPLTIGLGAAPYMIFQYIEFGRVSSIEKSFPEFLRIIAEAQKSGINITEAVYSAEKSAKGPFKVELRKMAAQLSWGIPFPRAVRLFEDRSNSVFVKRMMTVVMEAYNSGGDIAEAMDSVSTNAMVIKDLEEERVAKLYQQVVVMYVIFFIFLGMVIILQKILAPMFLLQTSSVQQGGGFLAGEDTLPPSYYRNMFFNMVMIQAIFTGLLAGQLGEGKVAAGLKHSVIMLIVGLALFTLVLPPDQLLLDVYESTLPFPPGSEYHVQGSAYHSDGTPVVDAEVIVEIGDQFIVNKTGKDAFDILVPYLPSENGVYPLKVTIKDATDKKVSMTIQVTVGEE